MIPNQQKLVKKERNIEYYDYFIEDKPVLSDNEFLFFLPSGKNIFLGDGNRIIVINIESIYFAENNFLNTVCDYIKNKTIIIPDYKTASLYLKKEFLNQAISLENLMFIKNENLDFFNFLQTELKKGNYFEMMDYMYDNFCKYKNLSEDEKVYYNNLLTKDIATNILYNSYVYSESSMGGLFKKKDGLYAKKIEYSNKRAITGRIYCVDKFNIQNISHDDERRKSIISRFKNGFFINFDYESFETRLSMYLSENKKFIEDFCDKDLHEEMAKIIYGDEIIDKEKRKLGKDINHAFLFGAGKDRIYEIIDNIQDKDLTYSNIISFLSPISNKKEQILREEYKNFGYIKNYLGTFVYPNKGYALFNNYIQSTAADIVTRKIIAINDILRPYKTKITAAIHDSILIDFHPSESFLIDIIANEMKSFENFEFHVKTEKMFNLF